MLNAAQYYEVKAVPANVPEAVVCCFMSADSLASEISSSTCRVGLTDFTQLNDNETEFPVVWIERIAILRGLRSNILCAQGRRMDPGLQACCGKKPGGEPARAIFAIIYLRCLKL